LVPRDLLVEALMAQMAEKEGIKAVSEDTPTYVCSKLGTNLVQVAILIVVAAIQTTSTTRSIRHAIRIHIRLG
jgi:hypothetical protein